MRSAPHASSLQGTQGIAEACLVLYNRTCSNTLVPLQDEAERGKVHKDAASPTDIMANEGWDVLEGLRRAAVALQAAELLAGHGHVLFQEGCAPPHALAQMHAAAAVRSSHHRPF